MKNEQIRNWERAYAEAIEEYEKQFDELLAQLNTEKDRNAYLQEALDNTQTILHLATHRRYERC